MQAVARRLLRPATCIRCDLTVKADLCALVERIRTEAPNLDVLVNNAGTIHPGDFVDLDPIVVDRQLDVNLRSAIHLTHGFAPLMKARRRGTIVNVVSMGGILAMKGSAVYAAAKFGLRGFNQSLHLELQPHGVRVCGVFPSAVDTPLLYEETQHGGSPLNFVGALSQPDDVARAVALAMDSGRVETYVPYRDSVSSRLLSVFPWLLEKIQPLLERIGARGQQRYLESKQALRTTEEP